ncbi:MAG: hypothetical protein JWN40_2302 [Phycisphaerales bacterium]|nr:hypothetical protein [Phycisphaerales bacterium]
MPIRFYRVNEPYGLFSNFSPHPITMDGKRWPTTEHYFQAQKFTDPAQFAAIRAAKSPMIAARLGRDRKAKLRRDWESVKDDVMRAAVLAKFRAHADARELLLSTGDQQIIEDTTDDHYWGCGTRGTGRNRLGQILEEVRAQLRAEFE